eukprot:71055-Rhodomonas_salina.1
MNENDDKAGDLSNMPTPPPFDPSALMPPFGQPGKSRYEQFYKSSEDAIDADAEAVGEEGEAASNPFYVGYDEDELAALWAVHVTNFGAYDGEDDAQPTNSNPMGGLHDLVLEAIGESEQKKDVEAPSGALGLHELILEACEQADAEKNESADSDPK